MELPTNRGDGHAPPNMVDALTRWIARLSLHVPGGPQAEGHGVGTLHPGGPRVERHGVAEVAQPGGPQPEGLHQVGPRMEEPQPEGLHQEGPQPEGLQQEGPQTEDLHQEAPRPEGLHQEGPQHEGLQQEGPQTEDPRSEGLHQILNQDPPAASALPGEADGEEDPDKTADEGEEPVQQLRRKNLCWRFLTWLSVVEEKEPDREGNAAEEHLISSSESLPVH